MKLTFPLLFLLFSAIGLQAQDVAKGQQILSTLSTKYKGMSSMKADFTYTLKIGKENFQEQQKGTLYFKKGGKFRLDFTDQIVACDSKTLYTYVKSDNELQLSTYDPSSLAINPTEMFTMYEKGYSSAYMGEQVLGTKTAQLVELTPIDKKMSHFKVKVFVEKLTGNLLKTEVYEKNGTIYTYEVSAFTQNPKLEDAFFVLDKTKLPNVSVIDNR